MGKRVLLALLLSAALFLLALLLLIPRDSARRPAPRAELVLPPLITEGRKLAIKIAEEGVVLLKNNGALPLPSTARIAVFGFGQNVTWWYHEGGSSFIPLDPRRVVTLLEALLEYGVAVDEEVLKAYSAPTLPARTNEFPFTEEDVKKFAGRNDVAIIVISRYTSEDFDLPRRGRWVEAGWWTQYYTEQLSGTYYFRGYVLEDDELRLVRTVSKHFEKVVLVLNTPHAINITPIVNDVDAILWVGYPGEAGGYAVANVLLGRVSPSGKLPFTWAKSWEDYPSSRCWGSENVVYCENIYVGYRYFDTFNVEPLYPFGFGLSYTSFRIDVEQVALRDTNVVVTVKVTNVGQREGKEVVQVYVTPPAGRLEKEHQRLTAFAKTDLLKPGETQTIRISFDITSAASFDEQEGAWILEQGTYLVRVGNSSRTTQVAAKVVLQKTVVVERASVKLGSEYFYRRAEELKIGVLRRTPDIKPWSYPGESEEIEKAPTLTLDPRLIKEKVGSLPPYFPSELAKPDVEEKITLAHVVEDVYKLEELVGQMSVEELIDVTIGLRGSNAPSLAARRIPELRQTDGPNGVKLWLPGNLHGTAFPGASLRAATWNLELEYEMGRHIGRELLWAGISIWLAPGLNMHRNPLCGRNAEYYSEDPVLAGTMAAAAVKGLQSNNGVGATPKHFVANDQEAYRYTSDSIVSERALREIYLKAFEIAVRTARPWSVMTSYNKLNGIYTGNHFEICTMVLRGEWGFDGFVMTDWWSASYNYKAYIAGNDALMPYTDYVAWAPHTAYRVVVSQVKDALWNGSLTLGQLQRSALNILRVALRSRALANMLNISQEKLHVYEPPPDYFSVEKVP